MLHWLTLILISGGALAAPPVSFVSASPLTIEQSAQTRAALNYFEGLCSALQVSCASLPPVTVYLQKSPPGYRSGHVDGLFDGAHIYVRQDATFLSRHIFHELVHWMMESKANTATKENKWILEAIPFLAELVFVSQDPSPAENSYFSLVRSGSLSTFLSSENIVTDFGLVGLWVRYLFSKTDHPISLLKAWINWDLQTSLSQFDYSGYLRKRNGSADVLKFENLFYYFSLALYYNTPQLDAWGLYNLHSPQMTSGVFSEMGYTPALKAGCVTLPPFGFQYFLPDYLKQKGAGIKISQPNLRVLLLRGREKPLLISESVDLNSIGFLPWHRLHAYNPNPKEESLCAQ